MKNNWREIVAVLIAILSLAGLAVMWNAEGNVWLANMSSYAPESVQHVFKQTIQSAVVRYSLAIGFILLAVSISYILLGFQEDIETTLAEQNIKK